MRVDVHTHILSREKVTRACLDYDRECDGLSNDEQHGEKGQRRAYTRRVNANVLALRSSRAYTVVTLVRLDGAYMEGRMIARVTVGASLAEHHRDAANARKRRALIDGRSEVHVAPLRCGDGTHLRPTPGRSPQAPGKGPGDLLYRCAGTP